MLCRGAGADGAHKIASILQRAETIQNYKVSVMSSWLATIVTYDIGRALTDAHV